MLTWRILDLASGRTLSAGKGNAGKDHCLSRHPYGLLFEGKHAQRPSRADVQRASYQRFTQFPAA